MATTNAVPKQKVQFFATGANLILIRVPAEERWIPGRAGAVEIPGTVCQYEFKNGKLEVEPDQDVLPTGELGEDETAVDWLRRHPFFGDRFFEIEQTPPPPDEILSEITRLTAKGDTDALAEIYDTEIEGYKRTAVISAAESAMRALEEVNTD